MTLPPAQILPVAATSADVQLLTGLFVLRGWAFQETTNAAGAVLTLHDGADDTAPLVVPITLATNESTRDYPPGNGILLRTGLFLEMVSGTVQGSIWYSAITHHGDVELVEGDQGPYFMRPGV